MAEAFGEDTCFDQLSELLQVVCQDCGQQNSLRALSCQACQTPLQQRESERESLSFLHAEGLDSAKAAFTSSHKLKRLSLALEGVRLGDLSLAEYRAVVGQVALETQAMQEIMALQALQDLESRLPPEAVDVMRETSDNINAFAQACQRMLSYDGSDSLTAEEGLSMAESAVEDMEATEREAAELQSEYSNRP